MSFYTKKIAAVLFFCFTITCPAYAVVIEPDPDLHIVMGDLYALAAATRLYYDDTHKTRWPSLDEIAHYLKKPLPDNWTADYRTAAISGEWWVGRRVPEFSAARKFLRENAASLGLYDQETESPWLGGAFVWISAMAFDDKMKPTPEQVVFKAARGEGGDNQHMFFNSPGTNYYWRSSLIFTTDAHATVIKVFGTDAKGSFTMPAWRPSEPEKLEASPVEVPPDFSLGVEEEQGPSFGDVIINPIPRHSEQ